MANTSKENVLTEHGSDPAVRALLAWKPAAVVDAIWDRNELTLTIERDDIREAAKVVRDSGYNFLEDGLPHTDMVRPAR